MVYRWLNMFYLFLSQLIYIWWTFRWHLVVKMIGRMSLVSSTLNLSPLSSFVSRFFPFYLLVYSLFPFSIPQSPCYISLYLFVSRSLPHFTKISNPNNRARVLIKKCYAIVILVILSIWSLVQRTMKTSAMKYNIKS